MFSVCYCAVAILSELDACIDYEQYCSHNCQYSCSVEVMAYPSILMLGSYDIYKIGTS